MIGSVGSLQDTALSGGAVSHGLSGAGPGIFHIHSQVWLQSFEELAATLQLCDPFNHLCYIIKKQNKRFNTNQLPVPLRL